MAVANTKSGSITSFDQTSPAPVGSHKHAAPKLISKDSAEVAAADDNGSVYRICRIPSSACVHEILVYNDAITGGTAYDIGVYQTAANGGAAVNDDVFASAIDMTVARSLGFDALQEAGTVDQADRDLRLWELLGLSADPFRDYDICFTADTVGSAAGTVGLEISWSR